jgi:hypothetical protein
VVAEDELLGGAARERDMDARDERVLVVVETVGVRRGEGHAERASARDDRDLPHRIGVGSQHADERVPRLVVGRPAAVLLAHQDLAAAPSTMRSSESVKSRIVTRSWSRRAAVRAASLARFAGRLRPCPGW